ncbi:MAG: MBOAT family O-acyltransferase [Bacteroidota bacterium]
MVFSSNVFLYLFLPVTLLVYLLAPRSVKNALLLLASLLFYAWGESEYVLIMLASILGNYLLALGTGRAASPGGARRWFILSLLLNLGLLVFFKYFNFLLDNLAIFWSTPPDFPEVHLPLGISFFTFQSISYQYDLYKGHIRAERNLLDLGLYISMFPQLIAGPIVRYVDIQKQMRQRPFRIGRFREGIQRFIVGMAKKILIANTFGAVVADIRGLPEGELSLVLALLLVFAYAIQIFFDFSGYSDMAIGLGKMFGFDFMENFRYPYIARSVREFWRRWHISLSTWFRDYLYIPLGGNRKGKGRTYFNLLLVFFLTGLWHGASWNFVIWGLFHGCFLLLERHWDIGRLGWLSHVYTLLVVGIAWVFFLTDDLGESWQILAAFTAPDHLNNATYPLAMFVDRELCVFGVAAILLSMPTWPMLQRFFLKAYRNRPGVVFKNSLRLVEWGMYMGLLLLCLTYISADAFNPFIYFRF